MRIHFYYLLSLLFFALLSTNCSNKHKSATDDDKGLSKVYHNVTAKNNGYFNAKIKYNTTIDQFNRNQPDNYQEILPIYKYGTFETTQSLSPTMDDVIKKTSIAIQLHENSKWADDCYLLMGKANFMKHEYNEAIRIFQYINKPSEKELKKIVRKKKNKRGKNKKILSDTHPDAIKAAKEAAEKEAKEEEQQALKAAKYGFLSHKPVKYDAITWLLKTFINKGNYSDALTVMSIVKSEAAIPKKLVDDFYIENARYYLRQGDIESALAPLDSSILYADNKKLQTRLSYIKAQIHQRLNQNEQAVDLFQQVLKLKPDYDMEFQARLQLAQTAMFVDSGKKDEVYNNLAKMAKDGKYFDYKDQVYYTMGNIALADEDYSKATNYFKQSAAASTINRNQKGLSYLKLAEIYFDQKAYTASQAYYDSTMQYLSNDYEGYDMVNNTQRVLQQVVKNLMIIEREDSLQFLASRPQREIDAVIFDIIEQWEADQLAKQQAEEEERERNNQIFDPNVNNNPRNNPRNQGGRWYFYNNNAKSVGFNDFKRVWGERELEDNWRRKAKSVGGVDETEVVEGENPEELIDPNVKPTKESLIANLPLTEEKLEASNKKIIDAYFNLGNLYKDELQNDELASGAFLTLNNRFPGNKHEPVSLYNLYVINNFSGNTEVANKYSHELQQKYPNSDYAMLVSDPMYYEKMKEQEDAAGQFYAATYDYYLNDDYSTVLRRKAEADSLYQNESIAPKFDFLATQVVGKTKDKEAYIASLREIVTKYPNHEVKTRAQEIITALTNPTPVVVEGTNKNEPKEKELPGKDRSGKDKKDKGEETTAEPEKVIDTSQFSNKEEAHFGLIVITDPEIKANTMMAELSDYNARNHSLDRFKLTRMIFSKGVQVIVLKQLKTKEDAVKYLESFKIRNEIFEDINPDGYDFIVISKSNYVKLFKTKDLPSYMAFFEENY